MNGEVQTVAEDVCGMSYPAQVEEPLDWARFVREEVR